MTQFLRNMAVACLGLMLLVGMLAASFMMGLLLIAAVITIWLYLKLRKAGIINIPKGNNPTYHPDSGIIEADYVIVEEKEERIPDNKA